MSPLAVPSLPSTLNVVGSSPLSDTTPERWRNEWRQSHQDEPQPRCGANVCLGNHRENSTIWPSRTGRQDQEPNGNHRVGVEHAKQNHGNCRNEQIVSDEHPKDQFPISRGIYKVVHRGCQTNEDHSLNERDESEEVEDFANSYGSVSFLRFIVPLPNSSLRIRSNRLEIFI